MGELTWLMDVLSGFAAQRGVGLAPVETRVLARLAMAEARWQTGQQGGLMVDCYARSVARALIEVARRRESMGKRERGLQAPMDRGRNRRVVTMSRCGTRLRPVTVRPAA